MKIDLTPYDKILIIRILSNASVDSNITDEEANMLSDFCDAMEETDKSGASLTID